MGCSRIAVIGAGTRGCGIEPLFAQAGFRVALMDTNPDSLEDAVSRIKDLTETCREHGLVSAVQAHDVPERFNPTDALASAACQADFVVEAVVEDLDVWR